jgi:hypothetical protein
MFKEEYFVPIHWFRTDYCPPSKVVKRLYPNYKQPTYKGKPVFGWTVTYHKCNSMYEVRKLISKKKKEGATLWKPPTFTRWEEYDDGSINILSMEIGTVNGRDL